MSETSIPQPEKLNEAQFATERLQRFSKVVSHSLEAADLAQEELAKEVNLLNERFRHAVGKRFTLGTTRYYETVLSPTASDPKHEIIVERTPSDFDKLLAVTGNFDYFGAFDKVQKGVKRSTQDRLETSRVEVCMHLLDVIPLKDGGEEHKTYYIPLLSAIEGSIQEV